MDSDGDISNVGFIINCYDVLSDINIQNNKLRCSKYNCFALAGNCASMPVDPRMCYRVSCLYQSRGQGIAGNVIGVDGTLNWRSSARMCSSLRLEGRTIIDFGCGNGRFMAMALANRAYRVLGCEYPENHAQNLIYFTVLEAMVMDLVGFGLPNGLNTEFIPCDIEEVRCPGSCILSISSILSIILGPPFGQLDVMPGYPGTLPDCVYTFWVGMSAGTQLAILKLCALCPSVDTMAVFRCPNWSRPELGNAA